MGAFKRFEPGDQTDNVLILEPAWDLSSGSSGWHGAPEGSGSVSLYGGYNRQSDGVVREYRFQRTIQGTDSFGVLARSGPITASVHFAYMTNGDLSISERSNTRWGYEHWKTVAGLYDYYERMNPDYTTSSYNHYCLYFHSASKNVVMTPLRRPADGTPLFSTASFTIESWVKPFSTGSAINTIQSLNRNYWFGLTGSTGRLTISGAFGSFESSVGLELGKWSHVAYAYNANDSTGKLYINNADVGTTSHSPITITSFTASLTVGAVWSGTLSANLESAFTQTARGGMLGTAFHGLIGESRVWGSCLTPAQISGTHNSRLTGTIATVPLACLQLSEGPLIQNSSALVRGSGVIDQAYYQRAVRDDDFKWIQGRLADFSDRVAPVWLPNDNNNFYLTKQLVTSSLTSLKLTAPFIETLRPDDVSRMLVLTVPAGMYGRSIKRGSLRLVDRAFSSQGIVRTLVDDSRGGLYISGSMFASSGSYIESYGGVEWNKVGNVFYDEGIIVIKDNSLLDFGAVWPQSSLTPNDTLQVSFRGESRIPVKTLMCRIERGDINASLNQTFWDEEEDGDRVRRNPSGSLYVSTVGLYNSEHELIGVARLAEPLRVRHRDRINIKLRMDF